MDRRESLRISDERAHDRHPIRWDEHLIDGIRQAQQLGLKVMLKPHIWLSEQDGGDWRGTIGFDTEREWKEWFSNYERFLLHYTQIAAQTEAEILCVSV